MKNLKLLVVLFCYFSNASAQNALKVEYEVIKNIANISGLDKLGEDSRKKIIEQMSKPEKEILYYYKGDTFYTNEEKSEIELSSDTSKKDEQTTLTRKLNYKPVKVRYYKTKNKNYVYSYYNYANEEFYNLLKPNWKKIEYKNETQKIDDFECKLVELVSDKDKTIKVWYTEMLPVNAGPKHYSGFPGLVLKVETPTFTIYATKISNEAKESDIEKIDPKLNVYEGSDFDKKKDEVKTKMAQPKETRRTIQL